MDDGVLSSDVEFQEYANYVRIILDRSGLREAKSLDEAEMAVLLGYGISDPREHYFTFARPTWGETGVASSSSTSEVSFSGNQARATTRTTYTPSYGITGHTTELSSYTTYARHALVRAFDYRDHASGREPPEIWRTAIVSEGSGGDLRAVFPILMAAASDLMGTDTGRAVERTLRLDSPEVTWITTARPSGHARAAPSRSRRTALEGDDADAEEPSDATPENGAVSLEEDANAAPAPSAPPSGGSRGVKKRPSATSPNFGAAGTPRSVP